MITRLGEINFINTLPLQIQTFSSSDGTLEITAAPPTVLNRAILDNQLDVSPVSSAFYLKYKRKFTILKEISISAYNPVESVLLFLPQGFDGLTPESSIMIPDSSETSVALMQYLIYCKTGLKYKRVLQKSPSTASAASLCCSAASFTSAVNSLPALLAPCICSSHGTSARPSKGNLKLYPMGDGDKWLQKGYPLLTIGNEALDLKMRYSENNLLQLDLAEWWQSETGLPFVFAVWVARKSWAVANPEKLELINRLLVNNKQTFLEDKTVQNRIISKAKELSTNLSEEFLARYFTSALSYNLDESHIIALSLFEKILEWLDDNDMEQHEPIFRQQQLSERDNSLLSV